MSHAEFVEDPSWRQRPDGGWYRPCCPEGELPTITLTVWQELSSLSLAVRSRMRAVLDQAMRKQRFGAGVVYPLPAIPSTSVIPHMYIGNIPIFGDDGANDARLDYDADVSRWVERLVTRLYYYTPTALAKISRGPAATSLDLVLTELAKWQKQVQITAINMKVYVEMLSGDDVARRRADHRLTRIIESHAATNRYVLAHNRRATEAEVRGYVLGLVCGIAVYASDFDLIPGAGGNLTGWADVDARLIDDVLCARMDKMARDGDLVRGSS